MTTTPRTLTTDDLARLQAESAGIVEDAQRLLPGLRSVADCHLALVADVDSFAAGLLPTGDVDGDDLAADELRRAVGRNEAVDVILLVDSTAGSALDGLQV